MDKPRVLLSHPTGNQNVRNAILSLAERMMLAEFWTTIAWDARSRWNRLLPGAVRTQLERRAYPEAPADRVRSVPWREMMRLGARSTPAHHLLTSGERPFSIIGVYRHFDAKVAQRVGSLRPDAVYAYEGGALETFREAKRLGISTIYELPSPYWYWVRDLLQEEAGRNPAFAGILPNLTDSAKHLRWKDEELSLADHVFVPSEHVRQTLKGVVGEERIRVVHYGAPEIRPKGRVAIDSARSLRVLFVGVLAQHKGISYLLDAIDGLRFQVELTLVGRQLLPNTRVDEACRRWRWFETLPHGKVLDVMIESDVLVLPSLREGFGLVVTEALACGLPVIVTPNVGAGDLIRDGKEGFVVPVCSADAIAERLGALHRDRELLGAMSDQALKTAARESWVSYRVRLADALEAVAACRR